MEKCSGAPRGRQDNSSRILIEALERETRPGIVAKAHFTSRNLSTVQPHKFMV